MFLPALDLASSFFRGTALATFEWLCPSGSNPGSPRSPMRETYTEKIRELLGDYVGTVLCPGGVGARRAKGYYTTLAMTCLDHGARGGGLSFVFGAVYEMFTRQRVWQEGFLEALEPMVLSGRIQDLSAVVMQDFVEHYRLTGRLQAVQLCITNLNIANLDLHQTIVLCWTHRLYSAIIYIYTRGLRDYATPVTEISRQLLGPVREACRENKNNGRAVQTMPKEDTEMGYTLLIYIRYCLTGLAFPSGALPPSKVAQVRGDIYTHLLARDADFDLGVLYPYVHLLLNFDTREFLNVLSFAFEEVGSTAGADGGARKQEIVDILLEVMVTAPQRKDKHGTRG